jgi:hypothetical protein
LTAIGRSEGKDRYFTLTCSARIGTTLGVMDIAAIIPTIAVGLNPYVGLLLLAGIGITGHAVPGAGGIADLPIEVVAGLSAVSALALSVDLVLGNLIQFAPRVRSMSHLMALAAGGMVGALSASPEMGPAVSALVGAGGAWLVSWMVTCDAARASRSRAWVGLGHVPVLMVVSTLSAILVPLAVALPAITSVLAMASVAALAVPAYPAIRASLRDVARLPVNQRQPAL